MPLFFNVLISATDNEGGILWSEARSGSVPTTEDAERNALRIASRTIKEAEYALEAFRSQVGEEVPTLGREQARVDEGLCAACGHDWLEEHDGAGCHHRSPEERYGTCPCLEARVTA